MLIYEPMKNYNTAKFFQAHTRGLPDDFTGPVRLIKIGDLDNNLCCGTHVSSLAHLQTIKLMYSESKLDS